MDAGLPASSTSPALPPATKSQPRPPNIPAPVLDGRCDLLKAIRDGNLNHFSSFWRFRPKLSLRSVLYLHRAGISLRKVEKGQQREVEKSKMDGLHDVASILARRVAMEFSDSENSGSESGSASDWDDETSA